MENPDLRVCVAICPTDCRAALKDGLERKARLPFRQERPPKNQHHFKELLVAFSIVNRN